MSKDTRETIKEETGKFMQKVYGKLTKTQAGVLSVLLAALVLLLFLCTSTGRQIIVFIAYVAFICGVVYGGYRLFKHTTARATGVPKEKKVREPEVVEYPEEDDEVPFETDGSEEAPTEEDIGGTEEPEEEEPKDDK